MAPMTRSRATAEGALATPLMAEYYAQRAGAGLIITEGIQPSAVEQGYTNTPGLHSAEQVEAWKQVTTAVHEAGGVIFAQLMHAGRIGHRATLPEGMVPQGPSTVQPQGKIFTPQGLQEFEAPHELTEAEIQSTIADFAHAAKNAIAAGFDGVEIHGANGYIIQQFLSVNANQRTDRWGGSAENRRHCRDICASCGATGGARPRLPPHWRAVRTRPHPGAAQGLAQHFYLEPAHRVRKPNRPGRPRTDRGRDSRHDFLRCTLHRQSRPAGPTPFWRSLQHSDSKRLLRWRGRGVHRLHDARIAPDPLSFAQESI